MTVGMMALVDAALVDLRRRIIPNRHVLLIATCGVSLRLWIEPGSMWSSLIAATLLLVVLGLLAHSEWIGGGDVKLIAAVTLLFPLSDIGAVLLGIAISGGLMAGAYLAMRSAMTNIPEPRICLATAQGAKGRLELLFGSERRRIIGGEPMPYALAVLGGVVFQIVSKVIQCLSATSCLL